MIPYGRQDISDADVEAVVKALQSDFLTQGPAVPCFEKIVAKAVGARFGVAASSATAALHIACLALELEPGDHLWTSPITFVASANVGLYCGATVDFVDIDPKTFNMCPDALAAKLARAEKSGTLPKIVIPVAMCGQSCDMRAIRKLSDQFGFRIVEDASHAIGAKYGGLPVGSGGLADITVFSFHPVKIITTGEGGLATTNDSELASRMAMFRSHGVTRDEQRMVGPSGGPWYYEQVALGYNYRMTELQAALGTSQMARLDEFVAARRALAAAYDVALADLPLRLPGQHADTASSWHLYVVQVEDSSCRRKLFEQLRSEGIGVNVHYIPVHTQPHYRALGFAPGDFPMAEDYYSRAISIPLFASMTEAQQDEVVDTLSKLLSS